MEWIEKKQINGTEKASAQFKNFSTAGISHAVTSTVIYATNIHRTSTATRNMQSGNLSAQLTEICISMS